MSLLLQDLSANRLYVWPELLSFPTHGPPGPLSLTDLGSWGLIFTEQMEKFPFFFY